MEVLAFLFYMALTALVAGGVSFQVLKRREQARRAHEQEKAAYLQQVSDLKARLKRAEVECREFMRELSKQDKRVQELEDRLGYCDRLRDRVFLPEIMSSVLAGIKEDDGLWLVMLKLIRDQQREEANSAQVPNLSIAAVHYNRGRAAALQDLQGILLQARDRAREDHGLK